VRALARLETEQAMGALARVPGGAPRDLLGCVASELASRAA
jgi:hypothetical protein